MMDEVLSLYETLDMFMVLVIGLLSALIGKNIFLPFPIVLFRAAKDPDPGPGVKKAFYFQKGHLKLLQIYILHIFKFFLIRRASPQPEKLKNDFKMKDILHVLLQNAAF